MLGGRNVPLSFVGALTLVRRRLGKGVHLERMVGMDVMEVCRWIRDRKSEEA
jgi:hypothetical protein